MNIIADGGSTKIDWILYDDSAVLARWQSPGLNPSLLSKAEIMPSLQEQRKEIPAGKEVRKIEFYGAGCTVTASKVMTECFREVFPEAEEVITGSDIIGAARVLLGENKGIACILGTGANSCLWDGTQIVMQTPALGYILGDEGSGAVLGKMLVNALYKGALPARVKKAFEESYSIDMFRVIENVYRKPNANVWLASLTRFIAEHIQEEGMEQLVMENFNLFVNRNILPYRCPECPVSFVGSVAYHFSKQLEKALHANGLSLGKIVQSPLDAFLP